MKTSSFTRLSFQVEWLHAAFDECRFVDTFRDCGIQVIFSECPFRFLAVSHWIGLVAGMIMFAIGTFIRVRSEEKLLRETFGNEWDEYARRVPAVVPFVV